MKERSLVNQPSSSIPIESALIAVRALQRLLSTGEITRQDSDLLAKAYGDEHVQTILEMVEKEFDVLILWDDARNRIDLSPNPGNVAFGITYGGLRERFGNQTEEVFLIFLGLASVFYATGNSTPDREFITLTDLEQNLVARAAYVIQHLDEELIRAAEDEADTRILPACKRWHERESLIKGKGHKTSRTVILKRALDFLASQKLISQEEIFPSNRRIFPMPKFHAQVRALADDRRYVAMKAVFDGHPKKIAEWLSEQAAQRAKEAQSEEVEP